MSPVSGGSYDNSELAANTGKGKTRLKGTIACRKDITEAEYEGNEQKTDSNYSSIDHSGDYRIRRQGTRAKQDVYIQARSCSRTGKAGELQ